VLGIGVATAASADPDVAADQLQTATPIKHLILVIGENRSFDHVYGTYIPKSGDAIRNLLSRRIVRKNSEPGANFAAARQSTTSGQTSYFTDVAGKEKEPYSTLPAPTLGGAPNKASMASPPFTGLGDAPLAAIELSLARADLYLLTTGATGAAAARGAPDARVANYTALPNGPFRLTGPNLPYDSYTGDTTHRFYQMWQQSNCSSANVTHDDPIGCLNDLYPFVITTYGGPNADHGGGTAMAFYNMQSGDAPLFKRLADQYTISDNHHQPAMGGTGIQHVFLGTGDDLYWSDGNGSPAVPPARQIANPQSTNGHHQPLRAGRALQ